MDEQEKNIIICKAVMDAFDHNFWHQLYGYSVAECEVTFGQFEAAREEAYIQAIAEFADPLPDCVMKTLRIAAGKEILSQIGVITIG